MKTFSIITSSFNQLENLKKIKPHIDQQSFKLAGDYEWIIADDGSTDGTVEWCKRNQIKCYHKEKNTGYDLVGALNNAAKLAEGQYLVWVMGDSFPKRDFLEQLNRWVSPTRMLNGIRFDIDWKTGQVVQPEWRVRMTQLPWWDKNAISISGQTDYPLMTLNSMCMPSVLWNEMGGIPTEFDGYGKMDWYMAIWTWFNGYDLLLTPRAIVYHKMHEDRQDTETSTKVFEKFLRSFIVEGRKSLDHENSTRI